IDPAPAELARVFMGRMELFTAATVKAVKTAIADNDLATLKLMDASSIRSLRASRRSQSLSLIKSDSIRSLTGWLWLTLAGGGPTAPRRNSSLLRLEARH